MPTVSYSYYSFTRDYTSYYKSISMGTYIKDKNVCTWLPKVPFKHSYIPKPFIGLRWNIEQR